MKNEEKIKKIAKYLKVSQETLNKFLNKNNYININKNNSINIEKLNRIITKQSLENLRKGNQNEN